MVLLFIKVIFHVQAVIRVRFPDNHTLEGTFHPSETVQSLVDLIMKVIARPDLPFYLCKHISEWHFWLVI